MPAGRERSNTPRRHVRDVRYANAPHVERVTEVSSGDVVGRKNEPCPDPDAWDAARVAVPAATRDRGRLAARVSSTSYIFTVTISAKGPPA